MSPTDLTPSSVYLDYAATTPVDPEVEAAMRPFFLDRFGNAGSVHEFGQDARRAVDDARSWVGRLVGAEPREIVFTSGATEANNAAIVGAVLARGGPRGAHIITAATEHHAVLEPVRWLERQGASVTILPVDAQGIVDPDSVRALLRPETAVVSIMHSNNEIGTIGPVADVAAVARSRGVLVHTDATQSVGLVPLDVEALGVDLLSMSAHKRYGPKGIGALYIRAGTRLEGFLRGGSQERGRRGGTENVPGIVGFGAAARLSIERMADDARRIADLRDRLALGLRALDGVRVNGHPERRLPGILSASFADADSESLLLALDLERIAASSGSACTSGSLEPSHVIDAIGVPRELAVGTLRFSLGRLTRSQDVDRVLQVLPSILASVRRVTARVNTGRRA